MERAYQAVKELAKRDLPTLRHLVAAKKSYDDNHDFNKDALFSLSVVLTRLPDDVASYLGTAQWAPKELEWARFFDEVGEDGFGRYLGIPDESSIPRGPGSSADDDAASDLTPASIDDAASAPTTASIDDAASAPTTASIDDAVAESKDDLRLAVVTLRAAQREGESPLTIDRLRKEVARARARAGVSEGTSFEDEDDLDETLNFNSQKDAMETDRILKVVNEAKNASECLARLCEDMNFTEGEDVYVAHSIGRAAFRGKFRGLDGAYAKVEDKSGVIHTLLPHTIFKA